jgi:hypothetical protein
MDALLCGRFTAIISENSPVEGLCSPAQVAGRVAIHPSGADVCGHEPTVHWLVVAAGRPRC